MEIKKIIKYPFMFVITILAVISILIMQLSYLLNGARPYKDAVSEVLTQYSGKISESEQKNLVEKNKRLVEYMFQYNVDNILPDGYSEESLKVEYNQSCAITQQLEYYDKIKDERKQIEENVARVRKLAEKGGAVSGYDQALCNQIETDYGKQIEFEVYDNQGVTFLFDMLKIHAWDFLCVLLLVVLFCGIFSREHERKLFSAIYSSKNGRARLYFKKLLTATEITFVYSVIDIAITIGIVCVEYGVKGLSQPIQSISQFGYYPYSWSILGGLVFICSMKVLVLEVITILICAISTCFKKSVVSALVSGIVLFGVMGFYCYCNHIVNYGGNITEFASRAIEKMKTVLFVPLLEGSTYFGMYDDVNILGHPLNRMWLNLIVTVLAGAVLFGLGLWSYCKRQRD